jgi:hypothetical protein
VQALEGEQVYIIRHMLEEDITLDMARRRNKCGVDMKRNGKFNSCNLKIFLFFAIFFKQNFRNSIIIL